MEQGRILVAEQQGAFVLKLVGDVRLTFCTALDEFLKHMFSAPDFASVVVDVSEAENIDSTTLGQLAKLAVCAQRRFGLTPALVSTNPDISHMLDTMGFERVFDVRHEQPVSDEQLAELPIVPGSEAAVRERVLEAHRTLMGLSAENQAQFSELVSALEGYR
ncbi:MAG: STAS domain-containing protein [Spongiibacteraceae bacterium]|jgi:anti-anti-sigma factor|nr:STAS domain-containing protein [Spongiibacteraceae bacterium]